MTKAIPKGATHKVIQYGISGIQYRYYKKVPSNDRNWLYHRFSNGKPSWVLSNYIGDQPNILISLKQE